MSCSVIPISINQSHLTSLKLYFTFHPHCPSFFTVSVLLYHIFISIKYYVLQPNGKVLHTFKGTGWASGGCAYSNQLRNYRYLYIKLCYWKSKISQIQLEKKKKKISWGPQPFLDSLLKMLIDSHCLKINWPKRTLHFW